jgi:tRNA threonylcarbamoyladenosine biosynthesis protein TsaB
MNADVLVLALDTTTREGSLALARDGELLESWCGKALLTHASRLPGDILEGLARHRLALADVDLFAVAAGPGSFTGLRIGIATIQGIAFAHTRPVVGVSVLDALAYTALARQRPGPSDPSNAAARTPMRIGALMDAQRREVFACLYEPVGQADSSSTPRTAADLGELRVVAGPEVGVPADVLADAAWQEGGAILFVGDGAIQYRELIDQTFGGRTAAVVDPVPALAPAICSIGARRASRGLATTPHGIRPLYVRRPDAELARDRRRREGDVRGGAGR